MILKSLIEEIIPGKISPKSISNNKYKIFNFSVANFRFL